MANAIAIGVPAEKIIRLDYDLELSASIAKPAVLMRENLSKHGKNYYIKKIYQDRQKIHDCYKAISDGYSRDLFLDKLALLVCYDDVNGLASFLRKYSEPIKEYGEVALDFFAESRYYFANNGFNLLNKEFEYLVDIGAYDGCSSISFRDCCKKASVNYSILAVEPDPSNYQKLVNNLKNDENIRVENIGLYSDNSELSFKSSCAAELPSSSCISEEGDIKIQVRTLDSMNIRKKVTIIKADPPGLSVAIEILSRP